MSCPAFSILFWIQNRSQIDQTPLAPTLRTGKHSEYQDTLIAFPPKNHQQRERISAGIGKGVGCGVPHRGLLSHQWATGFPKRFDLRFDLCGQADAVRLGVAQQTSMIV